MLSYWDYNKAWKYDDIRFTVRDIGRKPIPKTVCTLSPCYQEYGNLIGGAPELLIACKAAKGFLEGLDRADGNVYKDLKEAINKAEGKEA